MKKFSHLELLPSSNQSRVEFYQRLQWAGLLLLAMFLQSNAASSLPNATSDPLCTASLGRNDTCDNITIYDAIENDIVPFLQVKLNFTSNQLRTNEYYVMHTFNKLYNDQTIGFFLANDRSVNNDVCQYMIRTKLSPSSGSFFKCPWEYKCDYDPRRIPQVMWQADCSQNSTWQCSCSDQAEDCNECIPMNRKCEPVYYPVPILYNNRCNPFSESGNWEWRHMKVAVACASSNERAFY